MSLLSRLSSLDPESLSIALYPEMQGYATPDIRLANSLSLSRRVLLTPYLPLLGLRHAECTWGVERGVLLVVSSPISSECSVATPLSCGASFCPREAVCGD